MHWTDTQTDRPTDQQMVGGKTDDYRPLTPYRKRCGLKTSTVIAAWSVWLTCNKRMKRSKKFHKRPNRRQEYAPQPRSWQSSRQRVVTMLTPSSGAFTETLRRHPASRCPSTATPRHAASRGPFVETPPPSPAVARSLYRNTLPLPGIAGSL